MNYQEILRKVYAGDFSTIPERLLCLDPIGFPNYWVGNNGDIIGPKGKLSPWTNNDGRLQVRLFNEITQKTYYVHQLVAIMFIPNPNNFPEVNHKDENFLHNWDSNLEWCTKIYNIQYSIQGAKHWNHILSEEDVLYIRRVYRNKHPQYGQTALAKEFKVSLNCINDIVHNRTWKHLIKEAE